MKRFSNVCMYVCNVKEPLSLAPVGNHKSSERESTISNNLRFLQHSDNMNFCDQSTAILFQMYLLISPLIQQLYVKYYKNDEVFVTFEVNEY